MSGISIPWLQDLLRNPWPAMRARLTLARGRKRGRAPGWGAGEVALGTLAPSGDGRDHADRGLAGVLRWADPDTLHQHLSVPPPPPLGCLWGQVLCSAMDLRV